MPEAQSGLILVISGPAGSGKTTLCEALTEKYSDVARFVTTTTRAPRPGEVDGVDYHFLPAKDFQAKVRAGEFLEWAQVHGRFYGTQKAHVYAHLDGGHDVLFNIDVQGAESYRQAAAQDPRLATSLHTVFITAPDFDVLRERLIHRGDSPDEIKTRLETARREAAHRDRFDFVIESSTREKDFATLEAQYLAWKREN